MKGKLKSRYVLIVVVRGGSWVLGRTGGVGGLDMVTIIHRQREMMAGSFMYQFLG